MLDVEVLLADLHGEGMIGGIVQDDPLKPAAHRGSANAKIRIESRYGKSSYRKITRYIGSRRLELSHGVG